MKNIIRLLLCIYAMIQVNILCAQSPGLIVRPVGGNGSTPLNVNGDGYSAAAATGFTTDDIAESEVPFKIVPAAIVEPTGDLSTGPSGGFTDIVTRVDGSGFYLYKDASNIYFRLRIGGIISGSKGYSILIDTDGKMGPTGAAADNNYVAPSGSSPGNPGFEYEVVLQTNFQVAVYSIDGTTTPGAPATFALASNSQISVALSNDGNNPDYFYDWFVPLSAIGNPSSIRLAATTVTSPNSALQGTRSDIYGINDAAYANPGAAWQTVINAQPAISLGTFTGISVTCTAAPLLTGPVQSGSAVAVSGTWTRMDASKPSSATITLFRNGSAVSSTTVSTGNTWTINVPVVTNGDVFYAKAQAAGESQCLQSNSVVATACITPPAAPVLTCASLKGISGTIPNTASGNTVVVYSIPSSTASPFSTPVSTGANITYPTTTSFAFYTNGCSGGTNYVASGMYMLVTQNGACTSAPVFVCISSGSSGVPPPISSNSLAITQPLYPSATSISGSGAVSGDILRLYINGQYQTTITAASSSFSFTGLVLNAGDQVQVYSQTGTACMTQSAVFSVSCYSMPPVISVNTTGNLLTGATAVTGTSAYPGASVQLYKGTSPSGVATGSAVTVNSSGVWTVTVPALASGENYYAAQTVTGCTSAASSGASVLTPAGCPTITGNYADTSTRVNGSMPSTFTGTIRIYQDGALIGSQAISSASSWTVAGLAGLLYYNPVIKATAQASGTAESSGCSSVTVGCITPQAPVISPTTASINTGQTITYSISNVAAGNWYALQDNNGISYATSAYKNSNAVFNITSKAFSTAGNYSLKITADALTGCPASFALASLTVSTTLPLLLESFTGLNAAEQQVFDWSTSNEVNVDHFILEQSGDGVVYTAVATLPVQTTASTTHYYRFIQKGLLAAPAYYRLRIVDKDGHRQFSKVIMLAPAAAITMNASAGPNPFINSIGLHYQAASNTAIQVLLTDSYGRTIQIFTRYVVKGNNTIVLEGLDTISAGIYFLNVQDSKKSSMHIFKLQKMK
ncbi:MAG: T9SS type A sorting domain-containing protein [Chitinophagaceae bacterium]